MLLVSIAFRLLRFLRPGGGQSGYAGNKRQSQLPFGFCASSDCLIVTPLTATAADAFWSAVSKAVIGTIPPWGSQGFIHSIHPSHFQGVTAPGRQPGFFHVFGLPPLHDVGYDLLVAHHLAGGMNGLCAPCTNFIRYGPVFVQVQTRHQSVPKPIERIRFQPALEH